MGSITTAHTHTHIHIYTYTLSSGMIKEKKRKRRKKKFYSSDQHADYNILFLLNFVATFFEYRIVILIRDFIENRSCEIDFNQNAKLF